MAALERNVMPGVGPSFFRANDGELMFQFVIDPNNVIGPRPATAKDRSEHAGAYRQFSSTDMAQASMEAEQETAAKAVLQADALAKFDHDCDGFPGGSKPKVHAEAAGAQETPEASTTAEVPATKPSAPPTARRKYKRRSPKAK